jgi:hypothetical protein
MVLDSPPFEFPAVLADGHPLDFRITHALWRRTTLQRLLPHLYSDAKLPMAESGRYCFTNGNSSPNGHGVTGELAWDRAGRNMGLHFDYRLPALRGMLSSRPHLRGSLSLEGAVGYQLRCTTKAGTEVLVQSVASRSGQKKKTPNLMAGLCHTVSWPRPGGSKVCHSATLSPVVGVAEYTPYLGWIAAFEAPVTLWGGPGPADGVSSSFLRRVLGRYLLGNATGVVNVGAAAAVSIPALSQPAMDLHHEPSIMPYNPQLHAAFKGSTVELLFGGARAWLKDTAKAKDAAASSEMSDALGGGKSETEDEAPAHHDVWRLFSLASLSLDPLLEDFPRLGHHRFGWSAFSRTYAAVDASGGLPKLALSEVSLRKRFGQATLQLTVADRSRLGFDLVWRRESERYFTTLGVAVMGNLDAIRGGTDRRKVTYALTLGRVAKFSED